MLVYGPRKAGTTLLQSLLDGGPAMLMLPDELKLKYMARPGWPWVKPSARRAIERGCSFFPDLFRIGTDVHIPPCGPPYHRLMGSSMMDYGVPGMMLEAKER